MAPPVVCFPGDVYGTLTLIERMPLDNSRGHYKWRTLCECGKERIIHQRSLRKNTLTTCGVPPCSRNKRRLSPGETATRTRYSDYQRKARRRGLSFSISLDEFQILTSLPCHYCASPPSNQTKDRHGGGVFVYSGIDRVDSNIGYEIDNVVSACFVCNRAKMNMPVEEFLSWARRLAERNPV